MPGTANKITGSFCPAQSLPIVKYLLFTWSPSLPRLRCIVPVKPVTCHSASIAHWTTVQWHLLGFSSQWPLGEDCLSLLCPRGPEPAPWMNSCNVHFSHRSLLPGTVHGKLKLVKGDDDSVPTVKASDSWNDAPPILSLLPNPQRNQRGLNSTEQKHIRPSHVI